MLKKIGTTSLIKPAGRTREGQQAQARELDLYEDTATGEQYVRTEGGEYVSLRGAKTFNSATSRSYPVPEEISGLVEGFVTGAVPFPVMSQDEQDDEVEKFLSAAFPELQRRDQEITNKGKGRKHGS